MIILGLTGPSGSGKGALCEAFCEFGVPSLDTDAIYHELLVPPSACLDALVDIFGKDILHEDGKLNRPALAAIVFASEAPPEYRQKLNSITHRYILDETRHRMDALRQENAPAVLIDAPLLYESGFDAECDYVIAVTAPRALRIERLLCRDGISQSAIEARLAAQHSDDFYTEKADFVVSNDGDRTKLVAAATEILQRLGVNKR